MKKCPFCEEEIQENAEKCRFCGKWLDGDRKGETPNRNREESQEVARTSNNTGQAPEYRLSIWRRIRSFLVPRTDPNPLIKKRGFGWGWLIFISVLGAAALQTSADAPFVRRDMDIAIIISLPISAVIYFLIRKKIIEKGHYGNKTWEGSILAGLVAFPLSAIIAGFIVGLTGRPLLLPDPASARTMPGLPEMILLPLIVGIVVGPAAFVFFLNRRFKRSKRDRLSNEQPTALFSSSEGLGKWTKGLLVATLVLAALALISGVLQIELLSRIARGFGYTIEEATRSDLIQRIVSILRFLLEIGTTVAFLIWFHRMYKNLSSFGQKGLVFTPAWAVGFFFVPFFNLVRPFQAMREVWHGSDPGRLDLDFTPDGAGSRNRLATPPLVGWWWALLLISTIVSNIAARIYMFAFKNGTLPEAQSAGVLMVFCDLLEIPSALITIRLISRLTRWQTDKARLIRQRTGQTAVAPSTGGIGADLMGATPADAGSLHSVAEIKGIGRKKGLVWGAVLVAVPLLVIGIFLLTRGGEKTDGPQKLYAEGQYFTVGSTREEVLKIQGPPTFKLEMVWFYGDSQVQFDSDGKVTNIWDISKNLKVRPEKLP